MNYNITLVIEDPYHEKRPFVPGDVKDIIESIINNETPFTAKTITVEQEVQPDA